MPKRKGASSIDTPTKSKISRHFQSLGGENSRGAASATAREFGLNLSSGPNLVKRYDKEIRDGEAKRRYKGRACNFTEELGNEIDAVFEADDTATFREVAADLGMPTSTLHDYATKKMDYKCLNQKVRPLPSPENRTKRVIMGKKIVFIKGPVKNEFHQDEKYFICRTLRRKRKAKKGDKVAASRVTYAPSRRHQTQVMFSGCCGVGPDGMPIKIHFEWVCQKKTAKRNSVHHKKGDVYLESRSMDADYFEADLKQIGQKIRQQYVELGHGQVRVSLQIDSAGGHGMARGDRVFSSLAAMMDANYNIELVRQPGNTPMFNIMDLTIWQATQLEVDKMNKDERHREPELVKVCKKAWKALPLKKILIAFEWRKDCAQEAIETDGWCPMEGNGRGGSIRVHNDQAYAKLRERLKID
jgi:hypothetical protein